jgi:hypothetical protein
MHIPAFTAFLGITHQEYAHVFYRQPLDRRVRDQIAYKLGVELIDSCCGALAAADG